MRSFSSIDPLLDGVHLVKGATSCSSVYLLDGGRTLIDAGNMFGLIDEVAELLPPEGIERLLLTHGHFDHIGGVEEIYQAANPDLYVHPEAREHLRIQREPFPDFFDLLEGDGKLIHPGDGESLDGLPYLRVLYTPGHTAGDVCFFDERSGALFCGDTILPEQGEPIIDGELGGSLQSLALSLRKLLPLPVRHILPGHGEPLFHKGAGGVKVALYSVYKAQCMDSPELAWLWMGRDMLALGLIEDASQCAAKARQLAPGSKALVEFEALLEAADR